MRWLVSVPAIALCLTESTTVSSGEVDAMDLTGDSPGNSCVKRGMVSQPVSHISHILEIWNVAGESDGAMPGHESSLISSDVVVPAGTVGLNNLGLTCYMNAALQCLLPGLRDELRRLDMSQYVNKSEPIRELLNGLKRLNEYQWDAGQNRAKSVPPVEILESVRSINAEFRTPKCHDSHESMDVLLNALDLSDNPRPDEAVDAFHGEERTVIACSGCNHTQERTAKTFMVSVEIPKKEGKVTLEDCLESYNANEELDGYKCDGCNVSGISHRFNRISRCPKLFVVHLKRFEFSFQTERTSKNEKEVEFPIDEDLDLSRFVEPGTCGNTQYRLYGIVSHSGTVDFGHYVAKVKNLESGKWQMMNDEHVHEIKVKSDLAGSGAYLLFFTRVDDGSTNPGYEWEPERPVEHRLLFEGVNHELETFRGRLEQERKDAGLGNHLQLLGGVVDDVLGDINDDLWSQWKRRREESLINPLVQPVGPVVPQLDDEQYFSAMTLGNDESFVLVVPPDNSGFVADIFDRL